jgi:hypothetical protein
MYEHGDLVTVYDANSPFCGEVGMVLQVKGGNVSVEIGLDRVEYFHRSSVRMFRKYTAPQEVTA